MVAQAPGWGNQVKRLASIEGLRFRGESMSTTKRRTEITIEKERVLLIRRRHASAVAWCASCHERVRMVTADEAARMAGVSPRTIYRWIEAERLHFIETPEGLLLVCINSLLE